LRGPSSESLLLKLSGRFSFQKWSKLLLGLKTNNASATSLRYLLLFPLVSQPDNRGSLTKRIRFSKLHRAIEAITLATEGRRQPIRPFFGYFLWTSKESNPAGRPGPAKLKLLVPKCFFACFQNIHFAQAVS
jgi:hypothetical protein